MKTDPTIIHLYLKILKCGFLDKDYQFLYFSIIQKYFYNKNHEH
jgi:hypothetical protein